MSTQKTGNAERSFPSPFGVETISGTEGWQRMYPYFYGFSEERRPFEERQLWLQDKMHFPSPVYPLDMITASCYFALSLYTTRVFCIPPANGISHRVVNGYVYIAPQAVTDVKEIEERTPLLKTRSAFYYDHWDQLYEGHWEPKMKALIEELKSIDFTDLPRFEPEAVVLEHKGISSGHLLVESFHRLINNMHRCWQYHFEFLNLVYLSYLTFYDFCKRAFPAISDNTIARMVAGVPGVLMFQSELEVGKLARLAVTLGLAEAFKKGLLPEAVLSELETSDAGRQWLEAFEEAKDPWFYISTGTGFSHTARCWLDDLSVPFAALNGYIERLENGGSIERPLAAIVEERDRLRKEYRDLLPTKTDRDIFDEAYDLLAKVYPYAENHIFYVEHWHHSIWWNKARELGGVLVNAGFFGEPDDIFLFYYTDIEPMLLDLVYAWAVGPGVSARGVTYWKHEVEWRKAVMKAFREWSPPPALGPVPERITEPFTIQLWGITSEVLDSWLGPKPAPEGVAELKGFPASAGVAEGPARVIVEAQRLGELRPGEILVCLCTSPSWTPAFAKIVGIVTDLGGMSSHAAIVAREYGMPLVSGTAYATASIKTGDRIRVDGTLGVVTILR
jgi:pyruvate,water dikinase